MVKFRKNIHGRVVIMRGPAQGLKRESTRVGGGAASLAEALAG